MSGSLIACRQCDLVQRQVDLARNGIARCPRCNAILYRHHPASPERTLALTLGALVLFAIANIFPIVGIDIQGQVIRTTLVQAVMALYAHHSKIVALLLFVTTMAMPALEILALCYLLLALRGGRRPALFAPVFRLLQGVRPWNMVEIFMLGALVSIVRLSDLARIDVGIALWALAALMLVLAAIDATFDVGALWSGQVRRDESTHI